jgi:hypothetical protein
VDRRNERFIQNLVGKCKVTRSFAMQLEGNDSSHTKARPSEQTKQHISINHSGTDNLNTNTR